MNPYATMRQPRGEGTRGCKLRICESMDVTCASKVWCTGVLCVFSEGRKSFSSLGASVQWIGAMECEEMCFHAKTCQGGAVACRTWKQRTVTLFFFPRLIEIAKPSFISQRLVSHFAMWCLCRYASMPPQAPCGSGCFTQTQRYASAGPAVQGLAVWLLAMDVHHNWYMANNHGLDVYKIYIRI